MCGFQGIIFSSLIPTERGRLGSHSQKSFFPQRVGSEKRQKLRVELYFYVPQWVEHETSVFMRFSRKYFVFGSKFGVSYQLLKERGSKLAQIFVCGIKIDAAFGSGISAVASKLMPF